MGKSSSAPSRALRLLLIGTIVLLTTSCSSINYYAQAIEGHMTVMGKAEPIDELLARPQLSPELRTRLALARKVRTFLVEKLHLPNNDSYRSYSDLGRPYAVWNVVATDEFSMKPLRSCFVLAGCFSYRGYFRKGDAEKKASELALKGKDVCVAGATAYSTLGWFADPLLNTVLVRSETSLVSTMAHELAHQQVYVKGDSEFSEAFAVMVAQEAVKRWYLSQARDSDYQIYRRQQGRRAEFNAMLLGLRERLSRLYASPISDQEKRRAKTQAFNELREEYAALKDRWGGYMGYDHWMDQNLNNAHLALLSTYNTLTPAFASLLRQAEGNWDRFYAAVRQIAKLRRPERRKRMLALFDASRGGAKNGNLLSTER